METLDKKSLYTCASAHVFGDSVEEARIYCKAGHNLTPVTGSIYYSRLIRGAPLELSVCQTCPDYSEMGPPVLRAERGWKALIGKAGKR